MMRRRFPIATLSTFRRAAKRDAGVGVPSKAWRRALTPTEKSASSLLDHGVAEMNETFARKQKRLLPAAHGREQKVENLNDRIDAIEELRTTARANIQEVEERNAENFAFLPLVGPLLEWTIVLCLALADFPLNMTSFTLAPIGQKALYAVAVGIGVLIALAVVVVGRAAKVVVDEDLPRKKTVAYLFGIVIGFIALFIGVQGLALLRERFVEQAPAIKSLGVNLAGIGSAFVKIQLCLILLGVLAAFWAHNIAASRRRRETFKVLWHSVRIWLLTNRRDWYEVKLARVGAQLSVLTERFAARVEGLRGLLQYAIEIYRTVLLQRHPEAADPDIGDRPSVILPGRGLRPVPNRWAMPGSRRLTRWLFGDELPSGVRAPTPVQRPNGSGGHRAKPEELAE